MTDIVVAVDQQRMPGLLGASQAAGALGLDKYNPPLKVARMLRGEDVEDTAGEPARWGVALEPVIRGKYAIDSNKLVMVPTLSVLKEGWLRATPDGFVIDRVVEGPGWVEQWDQIDKPNAATGLLQVKTASAWLADDWAHGPPPKYEVQCRVEMAVCDLLWNDIVCLIGGQHLVQYRIHRDAAIEANILRDLRVFWELVKAGKDPDVDGSPAWRELASSKMQKTDVVLIADADMNAELARWKDVKATMRKLKEEDERIKTSVLLKMSALGATRVESDLGKVSAYKTGGRTDWKGYATSLGGTVVPPEKYIKPSKTWALRAPFTGEDE